ncbi:MAG: adenylate/guanylate cyclase domain-containing protein [Rhodospirillales bacterium]|nr:adenylate/guanylate cyclase domain-containing protein [Rhodospirillales bacterium]
MTTRDTETGATTDLIGTVADWLMNQALGEAQMADLVDGCCNRLRAAGIPLWRAHVAYRTLHPLIEAISLTWERGEGLVTADIPHGQADTSEEWHKSPAFHMIETGIPFLRRRLTGSEALLDFPLLVELHDRGATDFLAYLVAFESGEVVGQVRDGIIGSWATDRTSGFNDHEIQSLIRIQRRLAVASKVIIKDQTARNVLTTYLGPDAGRQVLDGQIKRGDGETIHAVIWFSDLRNSTSMADTMASDVYLGVLNTYFECTAGAVLANDGEVLRFIGDAVLAIFPIRDDGTTAGVACENALAAAREAQKRLVDVNRQRAEADFDALNFGLGLHVGDVLYGNIGVPERLEFSVTGPAANEAARIEGLTKSLGYRVVVSAEFKQALAAEWRSLGHHELRGVGNAVEVFSLDDLR